MAETWLIDDSPILSGLYEYTIDFISNGNNYMQFSFVGRAPAPQQSGLYYDNTFVCTDSPEPMQSSWVDQVYRTVTFEEAPTGTLLTWLESHAVKQVSGYSITYHSNGGTPEPEDLESQTNLPNPLPVVSKDNMAFSGWYLDSEFTTQAVAGEEINADTDLYAKFEYATLTDLFTGIADAIRTKKGTEDEIVATDFPSEIESISGGGIQGGYNVTFKVQGNDFTIISCKQGDSISQPTSPVVSGYSFVGWASTESASVSDITFPYTPTSDTTIYAIMALAQTAKVTGLGASNPSSVSFDITDGFFDSVIADNNYVMGGNYFVKINKVWRKIDNISNGQITAFTMADTKIDNNYELYPCFIDESGNELDYILIGKYMSTSSSSINSVSGTKTSVAIGSARTQARSKGAGYQLYDWMMQKLWQDLIIMKYESVNINSGAGIVDDLLGFNWQNSGGWIDGVASPSSGNNWLLSDKPSKYIDQPSSSTTGYYSASYTRPTTSNNISKLGYDSTHPFFTYPIEVVSDDTHSSYYCDKYYYSSGSHPVYSYVGYTAAHSGAFRCSASNDWSDTYGVRLCFRPL